MLLPLLYTLALGVRCLDTNVTKPTIRHYYAVVPAKYEITLEGKDYGTFVFSRGDDFNDEIQKFVDETKFPESKLPEFKTRILAALRQAGYMPVDAISIHMPEQIVEVPLFQNDDLLSRAYVVGESFNLTYSDVWNVYMGMVQKLKTSGNLHTIMPRNLNAGPPAPPENKFSVVKIYSPKDHSYFTQNVDTLVGLLEEFKLREGVKVNYTVVSDIISDEPDALYVIFTAHEPRKMPLHYIAYNLEQLCIGEEEDAHRGEWFYAKLRRAHAVWDYSRANIDCLQHRGGVPGERIRFVPQGHTSALETGWWHLRVMKPFDFIFVGTVNDRRASVVQPFYDAVTGAGRTMHICSTCWGNDKYKGRIGVNIPYNTGNTTLEAHRILPWITNRVWVLSLPGHDAWYNQAFADVVTIVPPEQLAAKALEIAAMDGDAFAQELDRRYLSMVKNVNGYRWAKESGALEALASMTGASA